MDTQNSNTRGDAIVAITNALASLEKYDEVDTLCNQAVIPTQADLNCGRLLAEKNPEESLKRFEKILLDEEVLAELRAEAALGATQMTQNPQWINEGLQLVQNDAATELQLIGLALLLQTDLTPEKREEFESRRIKLGQDEPDLVAQSIMEIANNLRNNGKKSQAIAQLKQALDLSLTTENTEIIKLELADLCLELALWEEASQFYSQTQDSEDNFRAFSSSLGLANTLFRQGYYQQAVDLLRNTPSPNKSSELQKTELIAQILSATNDPQAYEVWAEYADHAGKNTEAQYTSFMGQAEAKIAIDLPNEAIKLYKKALQSANEKGQKGWASLGIAEAQIASDEVELAENNLQDLLEHSGKEVQTQATIRLAQLYLAQERPTEALTIINNKSAKHLGPAWDATMEEVRAAVLMAIGDNNGAISALETLANRWPNEEEGQLPAWLGLADLHRSIGNNSTALAWATKARDEAKDPNYKNQAIDLIEGMEN